MHQTVVLSFFIVLAASTLTANVLFVAPLVAYIALLVVTMSHLTAYRDFLATVRATRRIETPLPIRRAGLRSHWMGTVGSLLASMAMLFVLIPRLSTNAMFFGSDRGPLEVTSNHPLAVKKTRVYSRISHAADDVVEARIYLGIHFRFADTAARWQGEKVAEHAFEHFLQPVERGNRREH